MGAGRLLPFRVGARRCPMGSLIEELQRREAAARQEADELRGEIARLTERLARAEERLARLEITRETVAEILGGAATGQPAAGQEAGPAAEAASAGSLVIGGSPNGGGEGAAVAAGPCAVGVAAFLPGPAGGPRRCGAAAAGREHRRCGRAESWQVRDRGAALEAETAGRARLAGRGWARAVFAAPPRRAGRVTPAPRGRAGCPVRK
jgi:hypothetical protein